MHMWVLTTRHGRVLLKDKETSTLAETQVFLLQFCAINGLCIMNTFFRHKEREREICLFASNIFNKLPLKTHKKKKKKNDFSFKIKQTDNKPYISNQRALLRYDAGVGRDKSHLITTPSLFKSFILNNLIN